MPLTRTLRTWPLGPAIGASLFFLAAQPLRAAENLAGPVEADIVRVIDGDTVEVRAHIWLGQQMTVMVRLAGVDAPELAGAPCPQARQRALDAKSFLTARLDHQNVRLHDIRYGKYAGRVVARMELPSGEDVSSLLASAGFDTGDTDMAVVCTATPLAEPQVKPSQ